LVLRIRNIIERRGVPDDAARSVRFGVFRFDLARAELFRGGEIVHLTSAEAGLLSGLAARAGEAVSREDLSQSAPLGGNIRKIEPDPRYPRYLQTVRGTGYALKPE
jgi:two-component system phosphate regulon response regulator OmpR